MTQPLAPPLPQPPPTDPGNALLNAQPVQLTTALVQTADGQRMALTIRTPSTTLTAFLKQADAQTWAQNIKGTSDQMSGSGLIVTGSVIAPNGQH